MSQGRSYGFYDAERLSHSMKPSRTYSHLSRHSSSKSILTVQRLLFLVLAICLVLCNTCEAVADGTKYQRSNEFTRLEQRDKLALDKRLVTVVKRHVELVARQGGDPINGISPESSTSASEPSTTATRTTTATSSKRTTVAPSTTSSGSSPRTTSYPLPRPFDTSLGSNFTSSTCPTFFNNFLNDQSFTSCLPFSLLLGTSTSFFQAASDINHLTSVMDATCNVVFPVCSTYMSNLANDLISGSNCGPDFGQGNPLVTQAYEGLLAYETMYQAGCLKSTSPLNGTSDPYCYAQAILAPNSQPADAYVYSVALGTTLPPGSRPTCSGCLKNTMAIFASAASNSTQPASIDYVPSAQLINLGCGPNFVNASAQSPAGSSSQNGGANNFRPSSVLIVLVAVGMTVVTLV